MLHEIDIATGRSRKETNWRNKTITWPALVEKLSQTHRTAETLAEYNAAKKTRQDEIKDIGGFVGGYMSGRRRVSTSIVHRQLVTLDVDFAKPGFWEDFALMYGNAACVYSTHKHTPEAPRLRLVIPLDREVMRDEYEPICRRIAGDLGIDLFDPTTYQPERLMYWPSTSKDGVFEFHQQDGPWLSADEVLGRYVDWRNSSEWPVSEAEGEVVARSIKKQGDPLEKPGIVGAFCRTYGIAEVIEKYLDDVYEPCDIENRYSYKEGSTAAGLVVYDDKFAYSHHGTDPVSGKLCNAFDMVRLHKFGLKDEDKKDEKESFDAMTKLALQDKAVRATRADELTQGVLDDFKDVIEEEPETAAPENDDWKENLKVNAKGDFVSSIDNVYLVLKNDQMLKDRIVLNEFEGRLIAAKNLPWRKVTPQTVDFTDDDVDCLSHYLEKQSMPFTQVLKALSKIRTEVKIHPVRDYLNAQKWDGVERLDTLFTEFLATEDSDYIRAVCRKTFVAAVARVFKPGIKFDTMPVLYGPEGIGKSTLIARMARQWFSDCMGDVHDKSAMESLRGVWIMEVAELSGFRKADQEAIKRFTSSTEDVYRPAYGRQLVRFPRQCVFIPTTNKPDFLAAGHVNRRFWPVECGIGWPEKKPAKTVFSELTDELVNQLWAEAAEYYRAGESLILDSSLAGEVEKIREKHTEQDDRVGLIDRYLKTLLPADWADYDLYKRRQYIKGDDLINEENAGVDARECVCAAEIWCELFDGNLKDMTGHNTKFIHDIMRAKRGWILGGTRRYNLYGKQKIYLLKTSTLSGNANGNAKAKSGNANTFCDTSKPSAGNAGNATGNAKNDLRHH